MKDFLLFEEEDVGSTSGRGIVPIRTAAAHEYLAKSGPLIFLEQIVDPFERHEGIFPTTDDFIFGEDQFW